MVFWYQKYLYWNMKIWNMTHNIIDIVLFIKVLYIFIK